MSFPLTVRRKDVMPATSPGMTGEKWFDPYRNRSLVVIAAFTIFKAFAAIFNALTAPAIFNSLTALLALAAYEAFAVAAAIAALIKTGTVPAVKVEAQRDFLDRANRFDCGGDVG
jgi:hypothetical protein